MIHTFIFVLLYEKVATLLTIITIRFCHKKRMIHTFIFVLSYEKVATLLTIITIRFAQYDYYNIMIIIHTILVCSHTSELFLPYDHSIQDVPLVQITLLIQCNFSNASQIAYYTTGYRTRCNSHQLHAMLWTQGDPKKRRSGVDCHAFLKIPACKFVSKWDCVCVIIDY
jgi:hypothetical protein